MIEISLQLPYSPSINHYYRTVRTKWGISVFIDKKGILYRENVLSIVINHKRGIKHPLQVPYFLKQRLKVELSLYQPTRHAQDIDNRVKSVFDALQHALVFRDDSQIDILIVERKEIIKGGKILARISEIC